MLGFIQVFSHSITPSYRSGPVLRYDGRRVPSCYSSSQGLEAESVSFRDLPFRSAGLKCQHNTIKPTQKKEKNQTNWAAVQVTIGIVNTGFRLSINSSLPQFGRSCQQPRIFVQKGICPKKKDRRRYGGSRPMVIFSFFCSLH